MAAVPVAVLALLSGFLLGACGSDSSSGAPAPDADAIDSSDGAADGGGADGGAPFGTITFDDEEFRLQFGEVDFSGTDYIGVDDSRCGTFFETSWRSIGYGIDDDGQLIVLDGAPVKATINVPSSSGEVDENFEIRFNRGDYLYQFRSDGAGGSAPTWTVDGEHATGSATLVAIDGEAFDFTFDVDCDG